MGCTASQLVLTGLAAAAAAPSMSAKTTCAPSATSRSAMALPMPFPAPVTTATFASKRLAITGSLGCGLHGTAVLEVLCPDVLPRSSESWKRAVTPPRKWGRPGDPGWAHPLPVLHLL